MRFGDEPPSVEFMIAFLADHGPGQLVFSKKDGKHVAKREGGRRPFRALDLEPDRIMRAKEILQVFIECTDPERDAYVLLCEDGWYKRDAYVCVSLAAFLIGWERRAYAREILDGLGECNNTQRRIEALRKEGFLIASATFMACQCYSAEE